MKRIGIIIFLAMAFTTYKVVLSQDIHFSQSASGRTPLIINPALTGIFKGDHRVLINYKDQWRSIDTPYKTYDL